MVQKTAELLVLNSKELSTLGPMLWADVVFGTKHPRQRKIQIMLQKGSGHLESLQSKGEKLTQKKGFSVVPTQRAITCNRIWKAFGTWSKKMVGRQTEQRCCSGQQGTPSRFAEHKVKIHFADNWKRREVPAVPEKGRGAPSGNDQGYWLGIS